MFPPSIDKTSHTDIEMTRIALINNIIVITMQIIHKSMRKTLKAESMYFVLNKIPISSFASSLPEFQSELSFTTVDASM
jgi:hypothetical protein